MPGFTSNTYTPPLTEFYLHLLLDDLQGRTLQEFGEQIRLFVHGGAVMILHPELSQCCTRQSTKDVDYIQRAFCYEWSKRGVFNSGERLQACISGTAEKYGIRCVFACIVAPWFEYYRLSQLTLDECRSRRFITICVVPV